jgi:DNA invertase Pin-like site-specific DNA recombinase
MIPLRCAIYARYSSDRQSTASIADQIRKCREYATRQGWIVLENHVYSDEGSVPIPVENLKAYSPEKA